MRRYIGVMESLFLGASLRSACDIHCHAYQPSVRGCVWDEFRDDEITANDGKAPKR